MSSRLGEEGQHSGEEERKGQQYGNGQGIGRARSTGDREVVQQPNWDDEHHEDETRNDHSNKGIDPSSSEIVDLGVIRLRSCFLPPPSAGELPRILNGSEKLASVQKIR